MLSNIDLDEKGYGQIREESIARIPVYSREWTNYNISDPGITILENLSAFMALQQSEINEVPEKIMLRLLALAGFTAREGRCATAYLLPENVKNPYRPPDRMKLYAQDICFELEQCRQIREMRLVSVRAGSGREDALLGRGGVKGGFLLFGGQPSGGETVYFFLSDLPEAGQRVAIYIELEHQFYRNPIGNAFGHGHMNPFAEVSWEMETREGYRVLRVEDGTCCFLQSGYVVFSMDAPLCSALVRDPAENAYRMRVTLVRAAYDVVPRIRRICGLLVPAVQRDTRSDVMKLRLEDGKARVGHYLAGSLRGNSADDGFFEVYGKEEDGAYHRYYDWNGTDGGGAAGKRYFRVEYGEAFTAALTLAKYGSQTAPGEALVVCRDSALMAYSSLGRLYGYDDQEMPLPESGMVYAQDFSALVVERGAAGDEICHVVGPGNQTAGEVCYHVNGTGHTLVVQDCGRYEGAELRLGTFAFYGGDGGNIRAGTRLSAMQDNVRSDFVCCTDVTDGCFAESFEQVRKRFVEDLAGPAAMVTEEDCVQITQNIPGLSIHKVGVCPVPGQNEIHIAVKPNSTAAFPRLSETYRREISRYLERFRMLTTRIVVTQPVYVPVHVSGTVSVRKHLAYDSRRIRREIEGKLAGMLDGIHSEARFGSRVAYYEIYRCLEAVDGVEEVLELSVSPGSSRWAGQAGLDILMAPNALYYPGDLHIEIVG